jgi:hypothetical protein
MKHRLLVMITAALTVVGFSTTASAKGVDAGNDGKGGDSIPWYDTSPSEVSVSSGSDGEVGTMHLISCGFQTGDVYRYPSLDRLEVTGHVTGCTGTPQQCRIEVDIQIWNTIDKQWNLYYNGPIKYSSRCPTGDKVTARTDLCQASSKGYNYRGRTFLTIVHDNVADADVHHGPTRQYYCL